MSFRASDHIGKGEATLASPITCHIIHIVNVAESKEKTLEEWRYYQNPNTAPFERMEHVNRPIIYGIDLDAAEQQKPTTTKATYKLLLRDSSNNYFYGIEIDDLPFLRPREKTTTNPLPMPLGGKLLLQKGTTVCDGVVFLKKNQCLYIGPDDVLGSTLNSGVVKKYIDIMEKQLQGTET